MSYSIQHGCFESLRRAQSATLKSSFEVAAGHPPKEDETSSFPGTCNIEFSFLVPHCQVHSGFITVSKIGWVGWRGKRDDPDAQFRLEAHPDGLSVEW